jgi:uncharacterized protein YkwD
MTIKTKKWLCALLLAGAALCGNAAAATLSYSYNFVKGWNLAGNSTTTPIPVSQAFGDKNTYNTIWKWDATTSAWAFYAPSMTALALATYAAGKGYEVLSTINPGEGFWVNALTTSTPTQSGPAYLLGANALLPTWNLVATAADLGAADFNRALSGVFSGAPSNVTTLWAWDATNQLWYFYSPSLDASNGLSSYIHSKGYEDFAATGVTLGNGTGFWVNYPSGAPGSVASNESNFLAALNNMRATLGIGQLTQNANLAQAAAAHANYLNLNASALSSIMGQVDPSTNLLYAHSEDAGNPGFLAATPQARDNALGYTGTVYDEILTFGGNLSVNASGTDAFNSLMNTVYHRQSLLRDNLCDVGLGTAGTDFVADMGCKVAASSIASGSPVVFPAAGQVGPYPYWEVGLEDPNPLSSLNLSAGTQIAGPVSVTAKAGDTLVTTNFTFTQNGTPVNALVLIAPSSQTAQTMSAAQTDSNVTSNNAFLIPLAPLTLGGVSYTATFTGTDNGAPVSKTWSFTTPANALTTPPNAPATPSSVTMRNGQSMAINFQAPSGNLGFTYSTSLPPADIHVVYLSSTEIMLTVESDAITASTPINLTLGDAKISTVPPQTIQITVSP